MTHPIDDSALLLCEEITKEQKLIPILKSVWQEMLPNAGMPSDRVFLIWIRSYDHKTIVQGITQAAKKWDTKLAAMDENTREHGIDPMPLIDLIKFAASVMHRVQMRVPVCPICKQEMLPYGHSPKNNQLWICSCVKPEVVNG